MTSRGRRARSRRGPGRSHRRAQVSRQLEQGRVATSDRVDHRRLDIEREAVEALPGQGLELDGRKRAREVGVQVAQPGQVPGDHDRGGHRGTARRLGDGRSAARASADSRPSPGTGFARRGRRGRPPPPRARESRREVRRPRHRMMKVATKRAGGGRRGGEGLASPAATRATSLVTTRNGRVGSMGEYTVKRIDSKPAGDLRRLVQARPGCKSSASRRSACRSSTSPPASPEGSRARPRPGRPGGGLRGAARVGRHGGQRRARHHRSGDARSGGCRHQTQGRAGRQGRSAARHR